MTMIRDEESGLSFQVVEPGSADDPFADRSTAASPAPVPSPGTGDPSGVPAPASTGDVPNVQPQTTNPTPSPTPAQPVTAPTAPATPAAELSPMQKAIQEGTLDQYIEGLVAEKAKPAIGEALRAQQSSYDKRINALQDELKAAREASLKAEREAKLNNEDLTEEEREVLRNKWELEDEKQRLQAYEEELDGYFRTIYIAKLSETAAQFGVTADELAAINEPEEMDAYVAQKELEFYRSGKHLTTTTEVPAKTVETPSAPAATPSAPVPAGATAPTDLGGNAPLQPPAQLEDGVGMDVMARNLNKLGWESVPIP